MSNEVYVYRPLVGNEIRLIHLEPPSRNSSAPELVDCTLIHRNLDHNPEYIALSYAWGDPTITVPILLDGFRFQATTNLAAALPILRHIPEGGDYWVDAICINQNDLDERSSQVMRMTEIYRQANEVLVWLGECSPAIEVVLKKIPGLQRIFKSAIDKLEGDCKWDNLLRSTHSDLCDYMEPYSPQGRQLWAGLNAFHDFAWWSRAWILQEIVCAKEVRWVCGRFMFDLDRVNWLFKSTHAVSRDPRFAAFEGVGNFPVRHVPKVLEFRAEFEKDRHLLGLLDRGRPSAATDARDKVYAFLGLAQDVAPGTLIPDYRLSPPELYTSVAIWYMSTYRSLEILGFSFPYSEYDLPSWVPDWSQRLRRANPSHAYHFEEKSISAYHASKDSLLGKSSDEVKNEIAGNLYLNLVGFEVGKIVDVKPTAKSEWNINVQKSWIPHQGEMIYSWTGETIDIAFRRTIVGDLKLQTRGYMCSSDWAESDDYQRTDVSLVIWFTQGRRLAKTAQGLMGIIPGFAEIGDSVFVLFGGSVLYLLRHIDENCYRFLGEAYFHGLMDGEAMDLYEQGQFKLENIVLIKTAGTTHNRYQASLIYVRHPKRWLSIVTKNCLGSSK
jgi:hypothetical protein